MIDGQILLSRFIYSKWDYCGLQLPPGPRDTIGKKLYLSAKGEKFPTEFFLYNTAVKMELEKIGFPLDEDVIRKYVYEEHAKVVMDVGAREEDYQSCVVWFWVAEDDKKLRHPLYEKEIVPKEFCEFKKGDFVSVHGKFTLEIMDEEKAKKINKNIEKILKI